MTSFWSSVPILVAGPCVLERDDVNLTVARRLVDVSARLGIRVVFKGSFDKANRATLRGDRGPGLEGGLAALRRVKSETGLDVLTDVHEVWQVDRVGPHVDALQVPAFLCRQTDLLVACGASGLAVNIKKGQWMAPEAMGGAVDKVRGGGGREIAVTERGTFFGYGDLIVDMRNFARIRAATASPVLFDATHSVQRPGAGQGGSSGGDRNDVVPLLRAAAAAGADGFFIETHPMPAEAPSDGATMWPLDRLDWLVEQALDVWHAASAFAEGPCSSR